MSAPTTGTGTAAASGPPQTGTPLHLAPDVVATPLPYGGLVLVNAVTLQLTEFGEGAAAVVDRLLALGFPPPAAGLAAWKFAGDLIEAGWFLAGASADAAAPTGR